MCCGFTACVGLRTWAEETFTDGDATLRVAAVPCPGNFLTEVRDRRSIVDVHLLARGESLPLTPIGQRHVLTSTRAEERPQRGGHRLGT